MSTGSTDISGDPERLSHDETARGLQLVVREGIASQTMESLTKGVFLIALALQLDASNFVIGLLGAIPFLSNLFQIPAVLMVERLRDRRKIVMRAHLAARAFLLPVAAAPLLFEPKIALAVIIVAVAVRYSIGAMAGCAWNSWMRDLVPKIILGKFFGRRLFYSTTVAAFVGLAAGFFLDWWELMYPEERFAGFALLFAGGCVVGISAAFIVRFIPHPKMKSPEAQHYDAANFSLAFMRAPLGDPNFRSLIGFLMMWNFAVNLASPFFAVYMLKTLGYSMTFVVSITLMSQLLNAFSLQMWGKYADAFSQKAVLGVCGSLFIFCIFGWTFTTFPERHFLTTPLLIFLHFIMGISISGMNLTTSNMAFKLTPSSKATPYLAMNTVLTSLAAGVAPLFGGFFADFVQDKTLSLDLHWKTAELSLYLPTIIISGWDFFFLLATLVGLYALRRLAKVREDGEQGDTRAFLQREILLDTGKVLRSLSTVDGLRDLTMAPMAMMINMVKNPLRKDRDVPSDHPLAKDASIESE
ncbi:MAG: MFS transporter [Alphaproteobacteria bacterium]|nr:MFS transporter [Alphaproteobacteria bacterium]